MKSPGSLVVVFCIASTAAIATPAPAATARASAHAGAVEAVLVQAPLGFEENSGQAPGDASHVARGQGYTLLLTPRQAIVLLGGTRPAGGTDTVKMTFVGARPGRPESLEPLPGRANHLIGRDPSRWRTDVPLYGKVRYARVYPGIDLVFYGRGRQLEYDLIVNPAGDPRRVRFAFEGALPVGPDPAGDLVLRTASGDLRLHKPVAYQDHASGRRDVSAAFKVRGGEVGIEVGDYDRRRPLVIDPVLTFSRYLGGSVYPTTPYDEGHAIAVDGEGSTYVTGIAAADDFPVYPQPGDSPHRGCGILLFEPCVYQDHRRGGHDAFVTKFDASGQLVYSTYLGGDLDDRGHGIAVDGEGNAYVTGETISLDFPTTAYAYDRVPNCNACTINPPGMNAPDVFVAKLNAAGTRLLYSTFLGGGLADVGRGIAVDPAGRAHVTGETWSDDFPATAGAAQGTQTPGTLACIGGPCPDAFVATLSADGSALAFSTYLGGIGDDGGRAVATDADGNTYVTGATQSPAFPTRGPCAVLHSPLGDPILKCSLPYQATPKGLADAFVTKLDLGGSLAWSTLLGGTYTDAGNGIAIRPGTMDVYVAGETWSVDFPVASAFQNVHAGGGSDAFVTRLKSNGTALIYSTYLGGSKHAPSGLGDAAAAIAVDAAGEAFVAGWTAAGNSSNPYEARFPLLRPVQTNCGGCDGEGTSGDAFVAKLDPAGALSYGTFLGGHSDERAQAIAVDAAGTAHVAGNTWSLYPPDFPTTTGPVPAPTGVGRAFVARLVDRPAGTGDLAVAQTASVDPAVIGVPFTYTVTITSGSATDVPNVAVVQTLSPEVSFVSATPNSGECTLTAAKTVLCNLGTVLAGSQAAVDVEVVPNKKAP
ncbi:MAG TPA: SBBP repeat-containing protein [Vicinamibacteria bacterium]